MEACARIRNGDCAAAIVAGGDEYNSLAAEYAMKNACRKARARFRILAPPILSGKRAVVKAVRWLRLCC